MQIQMALQFICSHLFIPSEYIYSTYSLHNIEETLLTQPLPMSLPTFSVAVRGYTVSLPLRNNPLILKFFTNNPSQILYSVIGKFSPVSSPDWIQGKKPHKCTLHLQLSHEAY
jgi:hypothetical protein